VGRKTAQRIGLELKEKIHAAGIAASGGASTDSDVVAALESLGYTASEARRAAGSVAASTNGELDARIKAALQELARSR
jgi:Holliday junction resolvasome RuvABC DNA-binding subunit